MAKQYFVKLFRSNGFWQNNQYLTQHFGKQFADAYALQLSNYCAQSAGINMAAPQQYWAFEAS